MNNTRKPRIALIPGDPCGIGPELTAKILSDAAVTKRADIILAATQEVIDRGAEIAGTTIDCRKVAPGSSELASYNGKLLLVEPVCPKETSFPLGKVSAGSGEYQLNCLALGLDLCRKNIADAMCFAPLNKEAMHSAGLKHEDESGFFIDHLNHKGSFGLLNTLGNLWTSRATSHVSHKQVSEILSEQSIIDATRLLDRALKASGTENPKIAVAGLNPHAGDGGMFGNEEIEIISPAVKKAQEEGINVSGPFPPDTIFLMGRDGKYDAIVTMYHDQGQIAMKLMGFDSGVTIHAGLPFPVTTSAHGSAFDIAGKGVANENALRQAFFLACSMTGLE